MKRSDVGEREGSRKNPSEEQFIHEIYFSHVGTVVWVLRLDKQWNAARAGWGDEFVFRSSLEEAFLRRHQLGFAPAATRSKKRNWLHENARVQLICGDKADKRLQYDNWHPPNSLIRALILIDARTSHKKQFINFYGLHSTLVRISLTAASRHTHRGQKPQNVFIFPIFFAHWPAIKTLATTHK